jgi:hypothetical protein
MRRFCPFFKTEVVIAFNKEFPCREASHAIKKYLICFEYKRNGRKRGAAYKGAYAPRNDTLLKTDSRENRFYGITV